jgi:phage terminase large subunit-like protein
MLPGLIHTDLDMTPRQAVEEKGLRKRARKNFLAYCQFVDPRYETPPHIQLLAAKLQQVALYIASGGRQGIGRLMILMPPQHGKSQIASRNFPAWLLGLLPDSHVILTSYGESLATRHSRFIRDQIVAEEYQAVFGTKSNKMMPVELSSDSRSTENWDLARPYRGGVKAAGVGGGITGLPAHLFIVDDPFKNREEAESEARRELVDDWYRSSSRTRLRPNAAVVIFHTRWHPDDLAGRLMQRMMSDPMASQFEIVCLPGLALESYPATIGEQRKKMRDGVYMPMSDPLGRKPGEALCPQWYDKQYLLSTKADVGLYDFEALYQQMPYSREGNMFKRDWFTIVDEGPGADVWIRIRSWDKAATAGGGARSAGVRMSWGRDDYVYIEHVYKNQVSSAERDQKLVEIGKEDYRNCGPFLIIHPQDPGSAGLDSAKATNALLAENGLIGFFEPVTGSKETNAGPLATAAQAGRVRLVRGEWNDEYLDEMAAFPKGRFKDQVDGSSAGYNKMREIVEQLKQELEDEDSLVYEERVNISPV